jgi:thiol-disulfide isomerase/thioredoxin
MERPKIGTIVVMILCSLLAAEAPADLTTVGARKPSPDLALSDSKGTTVKISNLQGRVVLLDFWTTWCGGCKVEIPWYMEFQEKYKERGLSVR